MQVLIGRVVNFPEPEVIEDFERGFLAVAPTGELLDHGIWNGTARQRWHAVRGIAEAPSAKAVATTMPGFVLSW